MESSKEGERWTEESREEGEERREERGGGEPRREEGEERGRRENFLVRPFRLLQLEAPVGCMWAAPLTPRPQDALNHRGPRVRQPLNLEHLECSLCPGALT